MLRRSFVYLLLCSLVTLTTAMTCEEEFDSYIVSVTNGSGDTIFVVEKLEYQNWEQLTAREAFEGYGSYKEWLVPDSTINLMVYDDDHNYKLIIFRKQTLDSLPLTKIIEQDIYDMRAVYTFEDLERINFTITYIGR